MIDWNLTLSIIKKELNLNNRQLEQKLGLSNGYIGEIERGKNKNPGRLISDLVETFRINPNWIFFNQEPMFLDEEIKPIQNNSEIKEESQKEKRIKELEEELKELKKSVDELEKENQELSKELLEKYRELTSIQKEQLGLSHL